jgi:3-deoxy-D-manno-octulosonate 8-phosphate phosphatase (KDO 8-P phosphatase)
MGKDIKLFITDIDGVWTDNSLYYDKSGHEAKRFNLGDSVGVMFLYLQNIPVAVISEENNEIIRERLEKLKVNDLFLGVTNKLSIAENLIRKYNITWNEVAFIGDDINDIKLLEKAGYTATPAQAPHYVKKYGRLSLMKKGGEGAFREFVEKYLDTQGLLNQTIEKYLLINEN